MKRNLDNIPCDICGYNEYNRMMRCCECNSLVCLRFDSENNSHIKNHILKYNHFRYEPFLNEKLEGFTMECNICWNSNILHLNYTVKEEKLYIYCNRCIPWNEMFLEDSEYYSLLSSKRTLQMFFSLYSYQSILSKEVNQEGKEENTSSSSYCDIFKYTQHFMNLEKLNWKINKLEEIHNLEISISKNVTEEMEGSYCFYSDQLLSLIYDDKITFKVSGNEINGIIRGLKIISPIKYVYSFITSYKFYEKEIIKINKEISSITHNRRTMALAMFGTVSNDDDPLKSMIFNPSEYRNLYNHRFRSIRISTKSNLNDSQVIAVEKAINKKLSLIKGPPGTGKTHIISEIVRILKKNHPNVKILVSSESNTAIDNVVSELKRSGIRVLRHISAEKYKDEKQKRNCELSDVTFSTLFENYIKNRAPMNIKKLYYNELKRDHSNVEEYRRTLNDQFLEYLSNSDVLCCTSILCGSNLILNLNFNVLIVDDSTQMTEPSLLIPLNLGCEQLILLGDTKQLSPCVEDDSDLNDYKVSMFKRLSSYYLPSLLKIQFRSHPEIASIYSELFYDNMINSDETTSRNVILSIIDLFPVKEIPIKYVFHSEKETEKFYSFYNLKEIEVTGRILKQLHQRGINNNRIGIVTPYKQHKLKMKEYLIESDLLDPNDILEIDVIDSYQGREKDIIIINCVISSSNHRIDFIKIKKKISVVLSRAKCALIIIGNIFCLDNEILRNMYKIIIRKKLFEDSKDIVMSVEDEA